MFQRKHLPNQLTALRAVLAIVFFALLAQVDLAADPDGHDALLWWATGLFIVAALTDALDGWLARRWDVASPIGRIMDPFCDKLLVLGGLILLAGPGFALTTSATGTPAEGVDGASDAASWSGVSVASATGLAPWMVVAIVARELLITSVRAEAERRGVKFGASVWGKAKTVLQMIIVPTLLAMTALASTGPSGLGLSLDDGVLPAPWRWLRDVLVWATVIVSVASGVPYLVDAYRKLRPAGSSMSPPSPEERPLPPGPPPPPPDRPASEAERRPGH